MPSDKEPNHFLFYAIAANPYLQSLKKAVSTFLPEAQWWVVNDNRVIEPYPASSMGAFEDKQKPKPTPALQELVDHSLSQPHKSGQTSQDMNGCYQGFVRFLYHGDFLGGIAINYVDRNHQELLSDALYAVEGYLSLLAGSLEGHDDLERVHDLWTETISIVDQQELLERLCHELCNGLNLDNGLIMLINEDGEFYPAYVNNFPEPLLKERNLNLTRYEYVDLLPQSTKVLQDVASNDPLHLWLTRTLPKYGPCNRENQRCYVVPFYRSTYLIGVFLTLRDETFAYSEAKENLARILAIGGAAALDNTLTLERMNQRRKALSTIHVVHRLISTTITTKELLPKIGQLTRQLLNARKCSIMLYDQDKELLTPEVSLGMEDDEVGQHPLQLGEELPGYVAENFNPELFYPADEAKPVWKSKGAKYPSESYLAVALFDTDIEGVITVGEKQTNFTPGDREILVTFAEQAILAIKNARIHEGERTITLNALQSIANLIETHDPATKGLTSYTCNWVKRIGQRMHLNDRDLMNITYAAMLRDTGMLHTLQSTYSSAEHRQNGPQLSLKFVQSLGLPEDVGEIVYHANELWNGTGYPEQLRGNAIPLGSRIITVANAFVSLLNRWDKTNNPTQDDLKKAWQVISRLSNRSLDPDVVKALGELIKPQKKKKG